MKVYADGHLRIYFGGAADGVHMQKTANGTSPQVTIDGQTAHIDCTQLFFAHQVHGVDGVDLHELPVPSSFSCDADFVCTCLPQLGIGVLTADCVPLVIYDPIGPAVCVVHAGWRGTVQGIALRALEYLHNRYQTDTTKVRIFFGPCAGPCCYAVDAPVLDTIAQQAHKCCVQKRQTSFFLDLVAYNCYLLAQAGVMLAQCDRTYHTCTICNHAYWSHRRQGAQAGRNVTVACLAPQSDLSNY